MNAKWVRLAGHRWGLRTDDWAEDNDVCELGRILFTLMRPNFLWTAFDSTLNKANRIEGRAFTLEEAMAQVEIARAHMLERKERNT